MARTSPSFTPESISVLSSPDAGLYLCLRDRVLSPDFICNLTALLIFYGCIGAIKIFFFSSNIIFTWVVISGLRIRILFQSGQLQDNRRYCPYYRLRVNLSIAPKRPCWDRCRRSIQGPTDLNLADVCPSIYIHISRLEGSRTVTRFAT